MVSLQRGKTRSRRLLPSAARHVLVFWFHPEPSLCRPTFAVVGSSMLVGTELDSFSSEDSALSCVHRLVSFFLTWCFVYLTPRLQLPSVFALTLGSYHLVSTPPNSTPLDAVQGARSASGTAPSAHRIAFPGSLPQAQVCHCPTRSTRRGR